MSRSPRQGKRKTTGVKAAKPRATRRTPTRRVSPTADVEKRLAEALDQQAATSEILRVISSSPTDVQPVFDTIAQSARRLCDAEFCSVLRFDGQLLHFAAHDGLSPEGLQARLRAFPMAPDRGSGGGRAILAAGVVQSPDVDADADYRLRNIAEASTYRSPTAVPMLRDGAPIGAIVV
jgi:two-component system NtrC family sensor kinase